MWSAINEKTGRVRDEFASQEDAENFLDEFFNGRASILDYNAEKRVVLYTLD